MKDDLGFGPENRIFSVFRRSFTTAFIASLVLVLVLPFLAKGLISWLGPLPHLKTGESLAILIAGTTGCAGLISLVLFITSIVTLLVSQRARYLLIFWFGCCISPIIALFTLSAPVRC